MSEASLGKGWLPGASPLKQSTEHSQKKDLPPSVSVLSNVAVDSP